MTRTGGAQRRQQLLREAVKLFGMKGYEAATLDAVAEAAGVRKQSLLYYFPTKEELFEACVHEVSSRVAEALESALDKPADGAWERTEAIIHAVFRLAEQFPEFPPFVREASWHGHDVVQRFASVLDPLRKRALVFLEKGMDSGEFRRQDPTLVLFMIYTAVVGSLTEAGVLRAVAGGAGGRTALRKREQELLRFVRSALVP